MAMTEEQRKSNLDFMVLYMTVILGLVVTYFTAYTGSIMSDRNYALIPAMGEVFSQLKTFHFLPSLNGGLFTGMLMGIGGTILIYFLLKLDTEKNYAYKSTEVAGTGGFMTEKELEKYNKQLEPEPEDKTQPSPNMIMSMNFRRPINMRAMIGNNNVLVVGGSGAGKSRFLIKPNLLQMNASFVTTDPSGEIIASVGQTLVDHGYKVKIFNLSDMEHSNCYNPLHYIRNEAGVAMLIDCFIKNTTAENEGKGDQFFTNAERLLYSACIFYLKDHCTDESKKNFANIVKMVNSSAVDENNPMAYKSPLDAMFEKLPKSSLAKKYYTAFKQASGKTLKSIIISCMTRLQPFMTPQVINLTKTDELELEKIGNEKTALFIIVPQTDRTYNFLASMLYSQLFETLYHIGEQQKANGGSEMLKIPVRCMMDEFSNIGEVPEFPSRLSTMRKYNISATVVLQDLSQIEAMYKDTWRTLVGNCSSLVFLGTQETTTLKYFSEMLGKKTVKDRSQSLNHGSRSGSGKNFQNKAREVLTIDEMARLDPKDCIVFTQNMRPVRDKKYKYESHRLYEETADNDPSKAFLFTKNPMFNTREQLSVSSLLLAQSEHARMEAAKEVSKPEDIKNFKLNMNINAAYNKLVLDKKEAAQAEYLWLNEGVEMAMSEPSSPVFIGTMSGIQLKTLAKIARQLSLSIGKPVILFSDLKADSMAGVGIDTGKIGLCQAADNDYIKNIMAHDEETFLLAIMTKAFDGFKGEVLQKIQYIKDIKKTANTSSDENSTKNNGSQRKPIMSSGKPISMHSEEKDRGNMGDAMERSMEIDKR